MAIASPVSSRRAVAALLTLTVVTGLVDSVSYLRLGHVFVANMTGNVVFPGLAAVLTGTHVLPFSGRASYPTIVLLAAALGLQNSPCGTLASRT